ncbi:MAG TPA: aldo/keto reductase [bacterium]|nr:aldo/keto reductase [bacterium]HPO09562.1 aldo/keto reductase [bacterium]HQP98592.1 aldo/keto reductase [bacterium]
MQTRYLGPKKLAVSAIGLGCMGMSEFYGPIDEQEARATLRRALDLGITFFDTADVYGVGHNERFIGEVLKDVRDRIVIATKFASVRTPDGAFKGICGRPEYVHQSCDASLQRLGIETIDLYYQHRVDKEVPIEETVGAMAELVKQGKVKTLGLSEVSARNLRRAYSVHPITAVQTEYSVWSREPEEHVLPTCKELGVGFVPYSPLGRGFLTGRIRSLNQLADGDFRQIAPRFKDENLQQNLKLLEKLEEIAAQKECTPGQLALAWLLAQDECIVPIPGTRRVRYLEENAAAADVQLTAEELRAIDAACPRGAAAGERYPDFMMGSIDTDE